MNRTGVLAASPKFATFHAAAVGATQAGATTTFASSAPTGTRTGDLLCALVGINSSADSIGTPTGWALITSATTTGTGTNRRTYLYSRTATLGADDTPTWTKTGTASSWAVTVYAFKLTTGIDAFAANAVANSGDASIVLPAVTPVVDLASLFAFTTTGGGNSLSSVPTHWIIRSQSTGSNPRGGLTHRAPWTTTASPTDTLTIAATGKWVAIVVALRPPANPSPATTEAGDVLTTEADDPMTTEF